MSQKISEDEAFEYLNKYELIQKINYIKKYGELNTTNSI